jgi:hypothetical protein
MVIGVSMLNKSHITLFFLLLISLQQLAWNTVDFFSDPYSATADLYVNLTPVHETEEGEDIGFKGGVEEIYADKQDASRAACLLISTTPIRGRHSEKTCLMTVLDIQSPPPDELR